MQSYSSRSRGTPTSDVAQSFLNWPHPPPQQQQQQQQLHLPAARSTSSMKYTRRLKCIRIASIITNALIFLAGCAIVSFGAWGLLWKSYIWIIWDSLLLKGAAWVVIFSGMFMLFLGLIGWGAWAFQSKKLVLMHCWMLLLLVLTLVTGGILATGKKHPSSSSWKKYLQRTLEKDYGVNLDDWYNREVTYVWDMLQENYECCAVESNGWEVYRYSAWYHQQPVATVAWKSMVPVSCCTKNSNGKYVNLYNCQRNVAGPPGLIRLNATQASNPGLHFKGCFSAAQSALKDYTLQVAVMGIVTGSLLIFGLIPSVALYRYLTAD